MTVICAHGLDTRTCETCAELTHLRTLVAEYRQTIETMQPFVEFASAHRWEPMGLPARSGRLVYLAGPLSATETRTVEQHVAVAVHNYLRLCRAGIPTHCPHLAALDPAAFGIPYDTWMALDFAIINRCTHVAMLDGWEDSPGAVRERAHALACGLTITTVEGLLASVAPRKPSAVSCGCDAGAGWTCEAHQ